MDKQLKFQAGDKVKAKIRTGPNSLQVKRGVLHGRINGIHLAWWVTCEGEHHARAVGEEMLEHLTAKEIAEVKRRLGAPKMDDAPELPHGMPED